MHAITAKINFAAYLVETVSYSSIWVAFTAFADVAANTVLFRQYILGLALTVATATLNFTYLLNEHDLKYIVMGRGWCAGLQSVFLTNIKRQQIIQTIINERRAMRDANSLHNRNRRNQIRPMILPPSSNQPTRTGDKKTDKGHNTNSVHLTDEELVCFKAFYRQSLTGSLLTNYKTNPLQFHICLKHLMELEQLCAEDDYHFDNDSFVEVFNEFTRDRKGRHTLLHRSGTANIALKRKSLVTLDANSLFYDIDMAHSNTNSILQNMYDNVSNEYIFDKLFLQLCDKQTADLVTIDHRRKDKSEVSNHELSEKRQPKNKSSNIQKSKKRIQRTNEIPITLFAETSNACAISANNDTNCDSLCHKQIEAKLDLSVKKKLFKNAIDDMNNICNLNIPDMEWDA